MGDNNDFVRLHITPLDAELVKVVIPASVLPVARNISYHTLETFPERRYGFVELPEADAEKLRKKLNGTTLKGCKMRIEKARPETRIEPTGEEEEVPEKKKRSKDGKDRSKKRKREPDMLEGVALHDRKVKRGWTETPTTTKRKTRKDKENKDKEKEKEKKKRLKSKYTDGEECLLKTKLPPNTLKNLAPEELEQKKRSKKKAASRQVVIHEFEKTTKFPSFLKTSAATDRKTATEFVEGKGWVDEEGNVVEEVKEKEKDRAAQRPKKAPKPKPVPQEPEDDDDTSSSGTSSEGTSSEEEPEEESEQESDEEVEAEVKEEATKDALPAASKAEEEKTDDDSETSRDDSSESDSSDEEEEQPPKAAEQTTPVSSSKASGSKPTPGSNKPLAIKIPPPETPSNTKVHPLEALYKRPKPDAENPTSAPKDEPFSFFGTGEEDEDETVEATPANAGLMTPFTRQDYEWRNIRSAAPTPDTAHPSRMQRFWASPEKDAEMEDDVLDEQQEEDEEDGADEDEGSPAQGKQSATSDFQKWFWENRRDLNRSWMTRRKTAAKEKRHRENKARASKAV